MQKLRSLLPGQHASNPVNMTNGANGVHRNSVSLVPEIGFQISIDSSQQNTTTTAGITAAAAYTTTTHNSSSSNSNTSEVNFQRTTIVPILQVHLIAARHLPSLFGFKVVQGYLIKVKLFPGSKRFDSSIQTNSWPKFNETFKFSLAPDIKPSLKQHSSRRSSSKAVVEFAPEELFAGHFVVFTVYALLELPPTNFNRLNKTYRSLRDKSSNLVQKMVEGTNNALKENGNNSSSDGTSRQTEDNAKSNKNNANPRDAIPPLTFSEARRNIGSVTCYLEPKIFHRNSRNGLFCTEEIWLPIKDLTSTPSTQTANTLSNSSKGVVEIVLELRDLSENSNLTAIKNNDKQETTRTSSTATASIAPPNSTTPTHKPNITNTTNHLKPSPQWKRMTSEMKRKVRQLNGGAKLTSLPSNNCLELRVTTSRMRCSNKVKDELESNAGTIYVKTSIFQNNILLDSWKSSNFYPSLSTKWDVGGSDQTAPTLSIPLRSLDDLDHLLIRTTLATKTKMSKKLVLGTVFVDAETEQFQKLREIGAGERIAEWHCYQ